MIESAQAIRHAQETPPERINDRCHIATDLSEPPTLGELPERDEGPKSSDEPQSGFESSVEAEEASHVASRGAASLAAPSATRPAPAFVNDASTFSIDDGPSLIDPSGWEAEAELPPPKGDASLAAAPTAIHRVISLHNPIDDSADWADFATFLPERAAPMPRAEDAESAAELRALLLRALREGSVPSITVEDFCAGVEESPGATSSSLLHYVIADLGAETDERFEYRAPHESFEVHVEPTETADEEDEVNEAIAFLEDLEAPRNDPMRLYMRDVQRRSLINAEEEIALAKSMEDAVTRALDALAAWPAGIRRVLEGIDEARSGARPLNSVTTGAREEVEPDHGAPGDGAELDSNVAGLPIGEKGTTEVEVGDSDDASAERAREADAEPLVENFFERAAELRDSANFASGQQAGTVGIRATLASLSLKRTFLMGLVDTALGVESMQAKRFMAAIRTLAAARDRMAGANLRLVLSLAKRYLYSGLPMDDLIQEGNIGLLKAVDKFDWRRGYKFSTMATWWIRQQVSRSAADDARTIRLPVHVHEKLQRLEREAETMSKTHDHAHSIAELAARLDMPERKVEALLRAGVAPLSMDEFDAEGERPFDSIEDENVVDPFEAIAANELRATLVSMLSKLGSKPERVMLMRFGLVDGTSDPRTLEEVGVQFELTRERIRQIEAKALRRLADRNNRHLLRGWVSEEGPKKERREQEQDEASEEGSADEASDSGEASVSATSAPPSTPMQLPEPGPSPGGDRGDKQGLSALDRLLAQAVELGIPVDDDRGGPVRSTWVNLTKPRDGVERAIVRKLIAAGFELWPGKGYWR